MADYINAYIRRSIDLSTMEMERLLEQAALSGAMVNELRVVYNIRHQVGAWPRLA